MLAKTNKKGKYLGFALGFNITSLRLATAANDFISPWISEHLGGPVVATWLSWAIALLSAIATVILLYLDRNKSRRIAGIPVARQPHSLTSWWNARQQQRRRRQASLRIEQEERQRAVAATSSVSVAIGLDSDSVDPRDDPLVEPTPLSRTTSVASTADVQAGSVSHGEHAFNLADLRQFSVVFWMLALSTVLMYGAVNPYIHILSGPLSLSLFPGRSLDLRKPEEKYAGVLNVS